MRSYRTKDGDTVDRIAWLVYGRQTGGVVEAILEANRGLADLGPVLPAGVDVIIPDAPEAVAVTEVRLWT